MELLDIIALFVALAGLFIFINTYLLKLPSSIGLMIMAMILSLVLFGAGKIFPDLKLGTERLMKDYDYTEVLYHIVISFMLFAGALQIDFKKLAQERTPVLILSTVGVLISTLVIGTIVYYLLGWMSIELNFLYCLVFGALISPTDPIAITSTLKNNRLSPNLSTRISGESLFNDGVSVVLALTLLDLAHAGEDHRVGMFDIIYFFSTDVVGGLVIGLFLGYFGYLLLKYIDNEQVEVEVLITLALVMSGTFLAEFLHFSAKQAAVIMGLVIGNEGRSAHVANATGDYVFKFWNLIEESFNAMLFVLIALEMIVITFVPQYFAAGFFAFVIVLFARWISVSVPIQFMKRKRHFEENTVIIMSWGSLKGGIPIALALSLPEFKGKDIIVTMTYIVVVISILYQGLTIRNILDQHKKDKKKFKHSHAKL